MAYSLRLPPALDADARARCDRLGISLNALICVALDAYLQGSQAVEELPGRVLAAEVVPMPAVRSQKRSEVVSEAPKLSRQQRRLLERQRSKAP